MSKDIPNFLLPKPGRRLNPYSNWQKYKDGDIVLNLNEKIERWEAHPESIKDNIWIFYKISNQ